MRYLLILLLILTPQFVHARLQGRPRVDSLLRELKKANEDTNKVSLLGLISYDYRTINPDTGIKFAYQALELATELSWKKGLAIGNSNLGLNYKFKSDYPKALECFFQALKFNEEIGFKLGEGANISNIGVIYQDQGNYPKALEFSLKSLKINEELGDSMNIAGDLGNIGIIYNVSKLDFNKALEYELRSLKIFEILGDKDDVARDLGNIGDVYHNLGDYPKSLEYETKALKMFEELGDKSSIAINLGNIGGTYISMAENANKKAGHSIGKSPNLDSAIHYLTKSIAVGKEIGDLESIIDFSKSLSEAYQLSGNYPEALKSYTEYATYKDSVYSTDGKLKIAKLETQRELEVKDKQIQLEQLDVAKRHNEHIFLIVVTALLLIIIGIGLRKYVHQSKSNTQLSKEKKKHLARIEAQTSVLSDIAYTQSHEVSGQVATILGLVEVFNFENPADPDNKIIIESIAEVTRKLDEIVKDMIVKENELNKYHNP